MKRLLLQLDTDPVASAFDAVVAYDGGADHVIQVTGVTPQSCRGPVEGAVFTRPPSAKRHTALFIGGSDLSRGEVLLEAVRGSFFSDFRVSVMLDSNGANTTAAAVVALLERAGPLEGREAVVLAGTGPVGRRAGALLALRGARVRLASRSGERSEAACEAIHARFGVRPRACSTDIPAAVRATLEGVELVLAAGKGGVRLLGEEEWRVLPHLEQVADLSTLPRGGIEGVDMRDRDTMRGGKRTFGGLAIGALKLRVHRACIARLFESNDRVLDAEAIYEVAQAILSTPRDAPPSTGGTSG